MVDFAGVYLIRNVATGRIYVGGSVRLKRRQAAHKRHLKNGRHVNHRMQVEWVAFGAETFVFGILLRCHPKDVLFYEQLFIDGLKSYDDTRGYNILPQAGGMAGSSHSPAVRTKISLGRTGWRHTPEVK